MDFLTIADVAEKLNVSERTIRNLCNDGEIPHFKIGTQYRIKSEDLENYLIKNRKEVKKQ